MRGLRLRGTARHNRHLNSTLALHKPTDARGHGSVLRLPVSISPPDRAPNENGDNKKGHRRKPVKPVVHRSPRFPFRAPARECALPPAVLRTHHRRPGEAGGPRAPGKLLSNSAGLSPDRAGVGLSQRPFIVRRITSRSAQADRSRPRRCPRHVLQPTSASRSRVPKPTNESFRSAASGPALSDHRGLPSRSELLLGFRQSFSLPCRPSLCCR
jgi:hypothetical protein